MEPEGSLPCSQNPAIVSDLEPDEFSPHLILFHIHFNIILPSTSRLSKWSLPFRFFNQNIIRSFHLCHSCYMPRPYHRPLFYYPNNTSWSLQVMKRLFMQYSLASRHFFPVRFKYSPQYPVLRHPQSMSFPQCERSSFTIIQNNG
jgi:hypothetical protein